MTGEHSKPETIEPCQANGAGQSTLKVHTMTHYEAIRTHIEASAPCSMAGVMHWATAQGFGGTKAVQAIQALKNDRIIDTSFDDDNAVIIDLV